MTTFVSTHGVELGDTIKPASARALAGYEVWAKFQRDPAYDTPDGDKGYSFTTDDPGVAERLRAINDYGIRELPEPPAAPVEDATAV
jgi:hypothetical protein